MDQNGTTRNAATSDQAATAPSLLYVPPAGMGRAARIVLILPELIPAWLATFLDMASMSSWIEVIVVPVAGAKLPTVRSLPIDLKALLAWERRPGRRVCKTLSLVSVPACDAIVIAPLVRIDVDHRQLEARLRGLQPDLILSLGPQSWAEVLAGCARWGCWNVDASLVDPDGAGMTLLEPLLKDVSATRIELELELDRTWLAPISMAASWGSTHRGSFIHQREKAFLKLPMLLLRALRRLASEDVQLPRLHSATLRLTPADSPIGFAAGARALAISLYGSVRWQLTKRHLRAMSWLLVLRRDAAPLDPGAPEVRSSAIMQAPPGTWWADPCMVEVESQQLVFVEEMTSSGKGTIACLELGAGTATRLGIALEEPGHLSYPQVFSSNAQWYMTVESSCLRRVSLYRTEAFPLGWERVADLVSGHVGVDPTLHFHEGHWYLFTTIAENGNSTWDELFLFVSEHLAGPFHPHPANPILSDVRRARSAGRLFHHRGKLIRPAQDCASGYGSAVVFNEVLELTPTRYSERPLSRLAPDWSKSLIACHTYSAANGVEMLDAKGYPPAGTPWVTVVDRPLEIAVPERKPAGIHYQLPLGAARES